MIKQRIMYVCSECAEGCPEACGHYDRTELRVMPDGAWLCESCFDNNDDNEFLSWGHLPAPEEYRRIPDSAQQAVEPLDEVFIEAWHGARKITVYRSTVIRVWGENIDTEMSNEPRTLNSVQAALDWLYAVPEGQWRRVDAMPDVGRKFICLWNDGSGAVMYWRHDHGYIDQEGDELNEIDWLKIDRWAYLPQDLEFWCETRAEDPMSLSSTQSLRQEG